MKHTTIPKWVTELDDEDMNKQLLLKLAQAGKQPLSAPREMVFVINELINNESLESILDYIMSNGWKPECFEDSANRDLCWIEAKKSKYILEPNNLYKDEKFFFELAKEHNAKYDGWYASVV